MDLRDFKEFLSFGKKEKIRFILFVLSTIVSGFVIVFSISPHFLKELNPLTFIILCIAAILPIWSINQFLWWFIWIRVFKEFYKRTVALVGLPAEAEKSFLSFLDKEIVPKLVLKLFPLSLVADLFTIMSTYFGAAIIYFTQKSLILLYCVIIFFNLLVCIILDQLIIRFCRNIEKDQLKSLYKPVIDELKRDKELIKHLDGRIKRIQNIIDKRHKEQSDMQV